MMKLAEVIPLHKSGSKHIVDNYRPISLLMTTSKILEEVVSTHVYAFLDNTGQLYSSQYGFCSKHSCEDAISELTRNILKSKEKGEHTISVFLDLSKAFNTLDYNLLYKKLDIYGIWGIALNWFKSYLSNRTMRTKCIVNKKTHVSEDKSVTFGAPQGSCLGPLLFLIFCNDLHHNLEFMKCILFADDTTIYCSNKSLSLLVASVEHDLSIANDWFKANNLTLNKKKSVCILFKSNIPVKSPIHLCIEERTISFVSTTKFLGVWIEEVLNWNIHIDKLLLTLQRNSHMLRRTKRSLSYHSKKILYYAQIYSHISYGIGVWGPMSTAKQKHKIEEINKKMLIMYLKTMHLAF